MFTRDILTDHSGSYRTQSLFLETNQSRLKPIITLKEVDWEYKGEVLPSLRKIYMEIADPEEYEVAIAVLGSWEHWLRLLDNKQVMKYIQQYRDELEIKIRSGAVKSLIQTAHFEGSKGTTAAKYIAEKGWDKRKAGAPTKQEVHRELKIQTGISEDIEDDLERLGLH